MNKYYFLFCELSSIKIINSNIKLFSDIITLSSNFIISNSYSNIYISNSLLENEINEGKVVNIFDNDEIITENIISNFEIKIKN